MDYYDDQWDQTQSQVNLAGWETASDLEFADIGSYYTDNEVECYLADRGNRGDFSEPS